MNHREIARALSMIRPGAEWNLRGDELAGIEWLDTKLARPTDEQILATIKGYIPPLTAEERIAALEKQLKALTTKKEP